MRKDRNKLVGKTTKRLLWSNKVKDGRRPPSRRGGRIGLEDAEKPVRPEGDASAAYKGTRFGPLKRFLRARVGQQWECVYAELCASCRAGRGGRTVLDQLLPRLVQRTVQLRDGLPRSIGRPLREGEFYVCPHSGRLAQHSGQARTRRKGSRAHSSGDPRR